MYRDNVMPSTRSESIAATSIERWRADTPGCTERIHLNNAGAALVPSSVATVVAGHLALESRLGAYEAAESVADQLQDVYASLATLLGTQPRNVAVVPNTTVAFSQALSTFDLGPGSRILTTRNDYASNQIMYLSLAQRRGVEVVRAEDRP